MTVAAAPTIEGVELFAGPGGWSLGARAARRNLLMLGIEWDPSACATARAAGHPRLLGDVVLWRTVLEVVALTYLHASPPCQGFSLAGSGKGRKDGERMIRAILSLAAGPPDPDRVQQVMDDFDMTAHDHRSVLTMEVLWWVAKGRPVYVSLEQVPGVLRVWEAMAEVLRAWGYDVVTGVLRTEQYGVPQTRRRAILLGRRDGQVARMPQPTHSRYYERTPAKLDPDVPKWVSMHEALTWGMTARPYPTVAPGSSSGGGPDSLSLGGSGARRTVYREHDEGRWVQRSNYSAGSSDGRSAEERGRTTRELDAPSTTITSKGFQWLETGEVEDGEGWGFTERPSPTVVAAPNGSNSGAIWGGSKIREQMRSADEAARATGDTTGWVPKGSHMGDVRNAHGAVRPVDSPSATITAAMDNGNFQWVDRVNNQSGNDYDLPDLLGKPSPVVACRELVGFRGTNANAGNGSTKSRNDGIRVTPAEAGVLQSFPATYPWTGTKSKQHEQVGNAVPPLLAAHCVDALLPPEAEDLL